MPLIALIAFSFERGRQRENDLSLSSLSLFFISSFPLLFIFLPLALSVSLSLVLRRLKNNKNSPSRKHVRWCWWESMSEWRPAWDRKTMRGLWTGVFSIFFLFLRWLRRSVISATTPFSACLCPWHRTMKVSLDRREWQVGVCLTSSPS